MESTETIQPPANSTLPLQRSPPLVHKPPPTTHTIVVSGEEEGGERSRLERPVSPSLRRKSKDINEKGPPVVRVIDHRTLEKTEAVEKGEDELDALGW